MKVYIVTTLLLLAGLPCFGQSDRGTISGSVSDPVSAAIAGANVTARDPQTGFQTQTVTTGTGNYTIPSLPAGVYEMIVDAAGFKKFTQTGITVQVAQTARIDVVLQIGSASESITVAADATLLKTESAEQSTTISRERLLALPLYFGSGQGGGAIRNPLTFATLVPGAVYQSTSNNQIRVNGLPNQSFKVVLDGQDNTNPLTQQNANATMPSMEAVEEFTLQSSNFSAEFGQVVGGLFNFTTRSGSNQFHGGAFEYFTNEALNAGVPFTDNGKGGLIRPRTRKSDYGVSAGGPVWIPKIYRGHDKTFFFFTYEGYTDQKTAAGTLTTVPTAAMRSGDFSAIQTGRTLGTDVLGRPIMENTIYDPGTARTVNGQVVTDPFPGNRIPANRIDPVAAKILGFVPQPINSGLTNNWAPVYPNPKTQSILSIKGDHSLNQNTKLSFYYMHQNTNQLSGPDGLPSPITAYRDQKIHSNNFRLNYDQSVTPTLLVHAGIGLQNFFNPDSSPASVLHYDAASQLGLTGGAVNGFPRIANLGSSFGGLAPGLGPTNANEYHTDKPTAVASATYVRGKHTYKAGGEFRIDSFTDRNSKGATGVFNFSSAETGLPYLQSTTVGGGTVGFPLASFLLGAVNNASVSSVQDPQWRRTSWSLFVQDTFRVSRKLTLDYGLRWDLAGQGHELYYRTAAFDPNAPNAAVGGIRGATTYEGYGAGRCNCTFAKTYPYAIGPRLGAAYQITSKTVLRAGWGISYGFPPNFNYITNTPIIGVGFNQLNFTSSAFGTPAVVLRNGLQYNTAALTAATYDPAIVPSPGQINTPPYLIDRNGGRPPRINQWNISLQRELMKDLVLEAAYVGNRGVWLQANSLIDLNGLTQERLASVGLNINSASDRALLTSQFRSAQVTAAGFKVPYATFPTTLTLAQALRPFPQFGNIPVWWAPVGNSWYDALQTKLTKRYAKGLDVTATFTWQKELTTAEGGAVNDVFNRANQKAISAQSQPLVLVTAFTYELPRLGNSFTKKAFGGWTVGGLLRYASGLPIPVPTANNNLGTVLLRSSGSTFANRVPGQPLFTQDLNCHCFDPNKTFVLNPAAWSDPAPGQFGTSAPYYSDYRFQRRPDEQVSFGRTFRIREGMSFQVRGEFFNIFNRTEVNNPSISNALATPTVNSRGQTTSGFGFINTGSVAFGPRSGQIVGQFRW
jgi:hypothetical protein